PCHVVSLALCAVYLLYDNLQSIVILVNLYRYKQDSATLDTAQRADFRIISVLLVVGLLLDWAGMLLFCFATVVTLPVFVKYYDVSLILVTTLACFHAQTMTIVTVQLAHVAAKQVQSSEPDTIDMGTLRTRSAHELAYDRKGCSGGNCPGR
ncbi:hypothetical protein HDU91_006511, partial [Kappamyces sp. JEL0680]